MTAGAPPRREGTAALSKLFDRALQDFAPIAPQSPASEAAARGRTAPAGDGFLYSGNRHESVPRALFLDRRLTPLERNAWQVFRLQLQSDGVTAFPTYDELRPYLASMPNADRASAETVARALTLLRLTRWLSLVRRRRDPVSGRIQGNLYVLHDEPLTPFEAMQLDPDYLGLVSQALNHAAKSIRAVGMNTLREISEDPLLNGRALPTRLQLLAQRLSQHEVPDERYPQGAVNQESEVGQSAPLRNHDDRPSDSESGAEPAPSHILRNPKEDRTVRTGRIGSVSTVLRTRADHAEQTQREQPALRLPERLLQLRNEQRSGALLALQQVEEAQRQAVIDEWDARCRNSVVRNAAGYLFGIIQKAIRGEFRAWAGDGADGSLIAASPPTPLTPAGVPASPEEVRAHVARLRASLRSR